VYDRDLILKGSVQNCACAWIKEAKWQCPSIYAEARLKSQLLRLVRKVDDQTGLSHKRSVGDMLA